MPYELRPRAPRVFHEPESDDEYEPEPDDEYEPEPDDEYEQESDDEYASGVIPEETLHDAGTVLSCTILHAMDDKCGELMKCEKYRARTKEILGLICSDYVGTDILGFLTTLKSDSKTEEIKSIMKTKGWYMPTPNDLLWDISKAFNLDDKMLFTKDTNVNTLHGTISFLVTRVPWLKKYASELEEAIKTSVGALPTIRQVWCHISHWSTNSDLEDVPPDLLFDLEHWLLDLRLRGCRTYYYDYDKPELAEKIEWGFCMYAPFYEADPTKSAPQVSTDHITKLLAESSVDPKEENKALDDAIFQALDDIGDDGWLIRKERVYRKDFYY